ncbi:Lipoprotein-releasing system transmembrane protein LolE [bioreactor metagenome]|uniref:Lipoprotein-releasing system transmembrane protein LolE n=1 Tax=bioreactor metagenome TaxID=1076179 RepID=A0A645B8F5_9ZZZZ
MIQKIKLAFRNLNRNRRRSILSALAISMGLALLMLIASVLRGEMSSSIDKSIMLVSGHIQIRSSNYVDSKSSLKWADLVADPEKIIADIQSVAQINALIEDATPRLYASAIISTGNDSLGVQVLGIDPPAKANDPFISGLTSGAFIAADDANGVVISQLIADKLKMKVGDSISLLVNTSNGDVVQQDFTIRGLYTTHTPSYDESTILMPLTKAQAITSTQNHASTIFILLKDRAQTDAVAAAIQGTGYQVKTWSQMNELMIDTENLANSFMIVVYLIVLIITATVIVNTLIMSVFERTREIGILSALGWKSRDIMALFMTEATMLAVGGIAFGIVLGRFVCLYFEKIGIGFGNLGLRNGFLLGERLYAVYAGADVVNLAIIAFVVTMLASLYPAFLAAHLEPIDALHGK